MSNLSLPKMTYANLNSVLGSTKWGRAQLAYATTIERVNDAIYVKHHENVIAVLEPDSVYVTNCGYETSTTANRLRKILSDNSIPFSVRIKQFSMRLIRVADWQGPLAKQVDEGSFYRATFKPLAGTSSWYLA
jgi:hypothetical protein